MTFDIRAEIAGEEDEEVISKYVAELTGLFMDSPEGEALEAQADDFGGFYWAGAMIHYGIRYCGVTPEDMEDVDLEEVLHDLFPRKVSCNASQAGEIVDELKAFWQFVKRAYGLENATECLAVLEDGATKKLERKLADPANFGMAKSFVAQGKEAGFDVETEEGLQAWVNASNSAPAGTYPLPNPIQSLGFSSRTAPAADSEDRNRALRKARKKQRKLKAASRRRNR